MNGKEYTMARKVWLFFVFGALLLSICQPAYALKDGLFGVGARFAWQNYKTPVLTQVDINGNDIDLGVDVTTLNKVNFGGDLQIKPIDRLAITVALDMGFSKHTMSIPEPTAGTIEATASFMSFGFLLGAKFYVIEPAPQKASLYLNLSGGKYISSVKNNASGTYRTLYTEINAIEDLASPLVIQFAVGAEFFATKYFSIGADVLGFRMAYSKSEQRDDPADGPWYGTQKLITLSLYSALTLNFGFAGSGKSKKDKHKEEDVMGEDGWGSSSGGGSAGANGGWGSSSSNGSAGADSGWGSSAPPPPASGSAPPPSSGNEGWASAPPPPADNGGGAADAGWEAQPPPPADKGGGAGGGWEAQPPPGGDNESPVKTNKPKGRGGKSAGGGGGGSAPPPPPPGY
jgi:uncharacterized membrane protein YgcG